jgi:prophage endopeptidase
MIFLAVKSFIKEFWLPIAVISLGVVLGIAYNVQLDKAFKRGYVKAQAEYVEAQRIADKKAQYKIAQIDENRTKESKDAQKEITTLRDRIRSGERRLYIKATCPTEGSGGSGVGNGETRAEINRADAENLITIAGEGDAAIIQLGAAQDIIRALTRPEN